MAGEMSFTSPTGSGSFSPPDAKNGAIDLVFIVDETGSMGAEIEIVKRNILQIISTIGALCPDLRCGLIGYHDHGDPVVVRVRVPFTNVQTEIMTGVTQMGPSGGGDYPEAVADGLHRLTRLPWRPEAAKTAVLIADAPPHGVGGNGDIYPFGCPCGEDWLEQAESCREIGIILHTVACRGLRERHVFQKIADTTWGRFFHLSDAHQLPKLITGVTEEDLDRVRIRHSVIETLQCSYSNLLQFTDEDQRLQQLLKNLKENNVRIHSVRDGLWTLFPRMLTSADLTQAICSARRTVLWAKLDDVFPTTGLSTTSVVKGGLFNKAEHMLIPLTSVAITAQILDFCCEVELTQTYVNQNDSAVEAIYKFPIDELAAITGFVAEIDEKRIVAKCMAREKAKAVYQAAVSAGKGGYLLEQQKADVFEMSVGNLQAQKMVKIRITYVTQLERENGSA